MVTYVNTSAAVKAESDICCTSGNAVKVIESLGVPKVIMIPDRFLAANVARQTGVEVIVHPGACEVHERFTPGDIRQVRLENPGITVLAHPECPPDILALCDAVRSTSGMVKFAQESPAQEFIIVTDPEVKNLFWCGASVQPGTGVPTVMISAGFAVDAILAAGAAQDQAAA